MAITTMPMTGPITAPAIQAFDRGVCVGNPVEVEEASALGAVVDAPVSEAEFDAVVAEHKERRKPGVCVEVVPAVVEDDTSVTSLVAELLADCLFTTKAESTTKSCVSRAFTPTADFK
jgi:hypothetical protein